MKKQEYLYQVLDSLRAGGEAVGTAALGALGLLCEGAEQAADAVRLRWEAARVAGELDGELLEVGELAYAAYTGNSQVSDAMEERMRAVDSLKQQMEDLNARMGRTVRVCPACGGAVRDGDRFCRDCGEKLE